MSSYADPAGISRIAVVGAGTIGASWASYFLARGLDVVAVEPAATTRERLPEAVARNWEALADAGLVTASAHPGRLTIVETPEDLAGSGVGFVQENVREELALKQETLRRLDATLPADTLIASSTSGLKASDLQARCARPGRIMVGHPMNPPHLIPLVELVGGAATDAAALQAAAAFYAAIGRRPVILNREVIGHLATRLTVALWREAAFLAANDVASVEDIDAAVTHGLGMRLAVAGPHLSYHMGGGEAGLAGFFAWARGPLAQWCADLGDVALSPGLEAKLIDGVSREAGAVAVPELAQRRDRALAALLKALHTGAQKTAH